MVIEQRTFTIGAERYVYSIRRSRKAKHINLHVSVAGGIELVVPWRVAVAKAERFLQEKQAWIAERSREYRTLREAIPRRNLASGTFLPLLDQQIKLLVILEPIRQRAHVRLVGGQLQLNVARQGQVRAALTRWYRQQALTYFTDATAVLAATVNKKVVRISIRSARSQWGSCGSGGRLSFTWRLLLAPPWVAKYVAAHEVAHLIHANHSAVYWQVVDRLCDQTQAARAWLRRHGHELEL